MSIVLDNNRKGSVGEFIKENTRKSATINVVSPLFTIYAYDKLSKVLETSSRVRFLFNEPTFIRKIETNQKEVKEFQLKMREREKIFQSFLMRFILKII